MATITPTTTRSTAGSVSPFELGRDARSSSPVTVASAQLPASTRVLPASVRASLLSSHLVGRIGAGVRDFTPKVKKIALGLSVLCWGLTAYLIYQFADLIRKTRVDLGVFYEVLCLLGAIGCMAFAIGACCVAARLFIRN